MFRRLHVLGGLLAGYTATLTTDPITPATIRQADAGATREALSVPFDSPAAAGF
ncbi:hypothetical protein GCM10010149_65080 [Nonomuraea roseoviolacea subsp. roseoviolacea]